MRRPKGGTRDDPHHAQVMSGTRWVLTPLLVMSALRLAACGDVVGNGIASTPIDLPADVADAVYTGHKHGHARGRNAIAFVREGRLFVVEQDQGIVFELEPANGDTPPLVMAIARELTTDLADPHDSTSAIVLTNMTVRDAD